MYRFDLGIRMYFGLGEGRGIVIQHRGLQIRNDGFNSISVACCAYFIFYRIAERLDVLSQIVGKAKYKLKCKAKEALWDRYTISPMKEW